MGIVSKIQNWQKDHQKGTRMKSFKSFLQETSKTRKNNPSSKFQYDAYRNIRTAHPMRDSDKRFQKASDAFGRDIKRTARGLPPKEEKRYVNDKFGVKSGEAEKRSKQDTSGVNGRFAMANRSKKHFDKVKKES